MTKVTKKNLGKYSSKMMEYINTNKNKPYMEIFKILEDYWYQSSILYDASDWYKENWKYVRNDYVISRDILIDFKNKHNIE